MSNYIGKAINPKTGEVETATFLDDYYGRNVYGVKFPDGEVYPEEEVEIPVEVESTAQEDVDRYNYFYAKYKAKNDVRSEAKREAIEEFAEWLKFKHLDTTTGTNITLSMLKDPWGSLDELIEEYLVQKKNEKNGT